MSSVDSGTKPSRDDNLAIIEHLMSVKKGWGHLRIQCSSSPIFLQHKGHSLSSLFNFLYLPVSIGYLWALILTLVRAARWFGFLTTSKYSANSNSLLTLLKNSNLLLELKSILSEIHCLSYSLVNVFSKQNSTWLLTS